MGVGTDLESSNGDIPMSSAAGVGGGGELDGFITALPLPLLPSKLRKGDAESGGSNGFSAIGVNVGGTGELGLLEPGDWTDRVSRSLIATASSEFRA